MTILDQASLAQLFVDARSHSAWLDKPVSDEQLRAVYELMKWGPTSANSSPGRIVFVKSDAAKEKLLACADAGNLAKIRSAPVTAIVAMDMQFYEHLPHLYAHADARSWFVGNDAKIAETAFRNSSLQGAYLMLAARAMGLDCGPMSGFNNDKLDAAFFAGSALKSNFICNLGYADAAKVHPRLPRLAFDQACRIA